MEIKSNLIFQGEKQPLTYCSWSPVIYILNKKTPSKQITNYEVVNTKALILLKNLFFLSHWLPVQKSQYAFYKQKQLFWYQLQPVVMCIEDVPKIHRLYWILSQVFMQM